MCVCVCVSADRPLLLCVVPHFLTKWLTPASLLPAWRACLSADICPSACVCVCLPACLSAAECVSSGIAGPRGAVGSVCLHSTQ